MDKLLSVIGFLAERYANSGKSPEELREIKERKHAAEVGAKFVVYVSNVNNGNHVATLYTFENPLSRKLSAFRTIVVDTVCGSNISYPTHKYLIEVRPFVNL